MELDFQGLVKQLRKDKYRVKVTNHRKENYKDCYFEKDNICGMFCTPSDHVYSVLNNRVAVERKECFDKWSKAPLIMKFPFDYEELKKHIVWLSTDEGYKYSCGYGFYKAEKIPRETAQDSVF